MGISRRPRTAHPVPLLAAACLALMGSLAPGTGARAQDPATRAELDARAVRIMALERRVSALEERLNGGAVPGPVTSPPAPGAAPPPRGNGLDVDPLAAERALERTLSQTGNLLLPEGKVDVVPFVTYQHTDRAIGNRIVFADLDGDGLAESGLTDPLRLRRDEIDVGVTLRVGLPWDSQVEARIPANYAQERRDSGLLGSSRTAHGAGIGNVRIGFAKSVLREDGWLPDMIGRVTYEIPTGADVDNGVVLESDFHRVGASVSLLKRQDPLAFTGSLGYRHAFEKGGIQPGHQVDLGLGVVLAASPETSLSMGVNSAFITGREIGGVDIAGSGQRQLSLELGISSIVHRNVLLIVSAAVGLTEDTPDFVIGVALPIRFGAW